MRARPPLATCPGPHRTGRASRTRPAAPGPHRRLVHEPVCCEHENSSCGEERSLPCASASSYQCLQQLIDVA